MDPTELRSSAGVVVPRRGIRQHLETGLVLTWHLVGRPRMLLNVLQYTGQSTPPQNYPTQNVNSAKVILLIVKTTEKPPKEQGPRTQEPEGRRTTEGAVMSPVEWARERTDIPSLAAKLPNEFSGLSRDCYLVCSVN